MSYIYSLTLADSLSFTVKLQGFYILVSLKVSELKVDPVHQYPLHEIIWTESNP